MMQVWNGAIGGISWILYKPEYVFATSAMAGAFFLPEQTWGRGVFSKPELKFWNGYGAYPKNKICAVALRQHIGCPTDMGHILHRYESSVHRLMGGVRRDGMRKWMG